VDYIADEGGFRATITTNEPGTSNADPADVKLYAKEAPATVHAAAAYGAPSYAHAPILAPAPYASAYKPVYRPAY